jgi:hypothetical protein
MVNREQDARCARSGAFKDLVGKTGTTFPKSCLSSFRPLLARTERHKILLKADQKPEAKTEVLEDPAEVLKETDGES